nr:hypothetical protein [Allomuricauda sp.]
MILERTNIQKKLRQVRGNEISEAEVLTEVRQLLDQLQQQDEQIMEQLKSGGHKSSNLFQFDLLESDSIYHIDHIKKICIDYRLRFLDSTYFKGEIPPTAVAAIKALEQSHKTKLAGFKIMAPSKLFKLKDKDDPLLFVPMGNNYYYLVHQWGNDLHPLRKLLVWPFKNIINLLLLVVLISLMTTWVVPDGLFSKNSGTAEFWIIFFFMFKWIAAVCIYYGFALGKDFNPAIWNSKYFNA